MCVSPRVGYTFVPHDVAHSAVSYFCNFDLFGCGTLIAFVNLVFRSPKALECFLVCELADKSNDKIQMTCLHDLYLNCVLNFKFLDLLSYHFLILNKFF